MASFLGDLIVGFGSGFAAFFLALPVIFVTGIVYKYPSSLRHGLQIFFLFVFLWSVKHVLTKIANLELSDPSSMIVQIYFWGMPSVIYMLSFFILRNWNRVWEKYT
jgi:hypothetical protein